MTNNKLKLKLDEANKFHVSLSIKGSSSEPLHQPPVVRFAITELKTGFACSFPTAKPSSTNNQDGVVSINIPPMHHIFHEGEGYEGKLEVYVGNHYATPTIVDIEFTKALQVEATLLDGSESIQSNQTPQNGSQSPSRGSYLMDEGMEIKEVESIIKKPVNNKKTKSVVKPVDTRILQKAMFVEEESSTIIPESVVESKPKLVEKKEGVVDDGGKKDVVGGNKLDLQLEVYKKRIKSLIAGAVREI